MVECKEIDLNNQEMDESGHYILIRVDFVTRRIKLVIHDRNHYPQESFYGRQAQDIYHGVLSDARSLEWFSDRTHIAYLGKELKKAEIALATGGSYYQE